MYNSPFEIWRRICLKSNSLNLNSLSLVSTHFFCQTSPWKTTINVRDENKLVLTCHYNSKDFLTLSLTAIHTVAVFILNVHMIVLGPC